MGRILHILFLLCVMVLSGGLSAAPTPAPPAEAHFLTAEPDAVDYWPCFSPDGKSVLFSRTTDFSPDGKSVLFSRTTDRGKTWELMVVPTSGGKARRLTRSPMPVSATRAYWSPHSRLIAFTGTSPDGKNGVWLVKPDGTGLRQLRATGLSDRVLYPCWYPDGKHLAVVDAAEQVIKRIDCRRRSAVPLTERDEVLTGMPSVSPDGKWIAFAGQKNIGQSYDLTKNTIWLINETGELRTLEKTPGQGRTPAWSPDGQWLAFESNRDSPNQLYAAFIIRRDGTGLRRVTPYEFHANHPTWSPDGKQLVFSARHQPESDGTGIAIIDVDTP